LDFAGGVDRGVLTSIRRAGYFKIDAQNNTHPKVLAVQWAIIVGYRLRLAQVVWTHGSTQMPRENTCQGVQK
jgi:hypothetical protein